MTFLKYAALPVAFMALIAPFITTTSRASAATRNRFYSYNYSTTTLQYYDGSGESTTTRQQRIRGFRQQSPEIAQKIAALGTASSTVVLMPVLFGVSVSDLTPNFGDPRDGGVRSHQGEDIMAEKGTPIVSPTAAVVLRVVTGSSEGNAVYTANPGGEIFVYMHLDRFGEGITQGTTLNQGSLIGYVGNTGNAAGGPAHLHFEIHDANNVPVDPFPRLTGELSRQQKIADLTTIFGQTASSTDLAQFLVTNFRSTFVAAQAANFVLPQPILNALSTLSLKTLAVRDLYKGVSGEDVRSLQILLNAHGYTVATTGAGSIGNETIYFGPATLAAVVTFQIAKGISPTAGYVGPLTRAALAAV